MNILFLGDAVGELGLRAIALALPHLIEKYHIDFVIVNGENVTHGRGLSEHDYRYLIDLGVDAVTLGNHWHGTRDLDDYIDECDRLVRPLNLLHYDQGEGTISFDFDGLEIRVTNLLGQAFMKEEVAEPIHAISEVINHCDSCIHIVDFHGESTSEKQIAAYCLDGKVSAVIGTHTHVQTNDARILQNGTAFMADAGMCGDRDGVIGFEKSSVINKIVLGQKGKFEIADSGDLMVNGCAIEIDELTYKATKIIPINDRVEDRR